MKQQIVSHPYYPVDLKLPNYVPNDKPAGELLGVFFGVIVLSLACLWVVMSRASHTKGSTLLKVKVSWFFMCGLIHFVLEGYFGIYHGTIPEGKSYLSQMCKYEH
jgi:cholestenol delta-isomerase